MHLNSVVTHTHTHTHTFPRLSHTHTHTHLSQVVSHPQSQSRASYVRSATILHKESSIGPCLSVLPPNLTKLMCGHVHQQCPLLCRHQQSLVTRRQLYDTTSIIFRKLNWCKCSVWILQMELYHSPCRETDVKIVTSGGPLQAADRSAALLLGFPFRAD